MLAQRTKELKPSATIEISAKIRELKKQGTEIISLNIGEPDFSPPTVAEEGVRAALEQKRSQYGAVAGFSELREAICEKLKRENGLSYRPAEICVSAGTKQAIYNALMAVCGPGDEVLLPSPCWVSYDAMVRLCGAAPVPVELKAENGFALDVQTLEQHITPRTRAVVINTPNNPTGAVYSREALSQLAQLAIKYDFWVISDEIYERILFDDNRHISIAAISQEAWEHCITTNGFSKAYAIPGWRVGYSAAPPAVAKAIAGMQGHMTSAAASLSQMGALYALKEGETSVKAMVTEYARRKDLLGQELDQIPDLVFRRPQGTFYYFVDVRAYLGRRWGEQVIHTSDELARYVLERAHVAIVPGEAFNGNGYVRISFSNSQENIVQGVKRMGQALLELREG